MSKLDGNERWKSKMLLTEHQEEYESRNDPKNVSPYIRGAQYDS